MLQNIKTLIQYRYLLYVWVMEDIREKYYETFLGPAWLIVQPLLLTLVFTVAFTVFARIGPAGIPYPVFFLVGYLPWDYFSTSITKGSRSVVSNLRTISDFAFPRELLVLSVMISALVDFLAGVIVVSVMFVLYRQPLFISVLWIIPVFSVQLILTAGLMFWLSTLNATRRDVEPILLPLLRGLFYLSPVIYPLNRVSPTIVQYYLLNPIAGLITGYRDVLFDGKLSHSGAFIWATIIAVGVFVSGYTYFKRNEWTFADVI